MRDLPFPEEKQRRSELRGGNRVWVDEKLRVEEGEEIVAGM